MILEVQGFVKAHPLLGYVIRCRDIEKTRQFYENLGISFTQEQHGTSPVHYEAELDGSVVLDG